MKINIVIEPGEDGYVVAHVPALKSSGHKVRLAKKPCRTFARRLIYIWSLSPTRYRIVK